MKKVYKLPNFCISIDSLKVCIPEILVYTDNDVPNAVMDEDEWFGMDLFYSHESILINIKDMYVRSTPKKQTDS